MRKFLKNLVRRATEMRAVGAKNFVLFFIRPMNSKMSLKVAGHDIMVRARTSDLRVAVESLTIEYSFLDDLLPSNFAGLIVDAGGYIGTAAIAFASRFPDAQVVSIEPSSDNISILRLNIERFPNVEVRHAALGPEAGGTITLRSRATGAWGFTILEKPDNSAELSDLEDVRLTSLDEVEREMGRPIIFLKLDIEGAEKHIFDSNDATLQAIPLLFIELHDRIMAGCGTAFRVFSRNRWTMRLSREKYLSIQSTNDKVGILKCQD